jgi:hypothetical protein
MDVDILVGLVELVFRAVYDRAVNVADHLVAHRRHGDYAIRVLNERCQFPRPKQLCGRRLEDGWQGFIVQLLNTRYLPRDIFGVVLRCKANGNHIANLEMGMAKTLALYLLTMLR